MYVVSISTMENEDKTGASDCTPENNGRDGI